MWAKAIDPIRAFTADNILKNSDSPIHKKSYGQTKGYDMTINS